MIAAAFAVVCLVWGSTYLFIAFAIQTIPPFLMAGSRFLVAGLLLLLFLRPRRTDLFHGTYWREAFIVGGLMLVGGNGGVTWAEQHVPSGVAALVVATVPLWIAMLDSMASGRPGMRTLAGLLMGFCGVAVLFVPWDARLFRQLDWVGLSGVVIASITWSIGSLISRRVSLPSKPLVGVGMQMVAGGLLLILLGLALGEWDRFHVESVSTKSFWSWVYLVVFGSCLGFSCYIWLMKAWNPTKVASYAYVNPVVALSLGVGFAGERMDLRTILAAAVILAAVVLITTARLLHQR
jgi:drug/metabolite transporter (DMT)-like permease